MALSGTRRKDSLHFDANKKVCDKPYNNELTLSFVINLSSVRSRAGTGGGPLDLASFGCDVLGNWCRDQT
jgi:hypothetical protein